MELRTAGRFRPEGESGRNVYQNPKRAAAIGKGCPTRSVAFSEGTQD